ncbi:MAG TPA: 16S rRNA (guanine(527)-N(7))-methyltransferase RsmG [Polyangiaceae bacterium]|jgi:16S rRNA (guanine527-N7)-methyltransferase|nr:16S rRNA (guanine(527)-N(7))-methyltransferase RsmG [Polyangiaceae bacterium]
MPLSELGDGWRPHLERLFCAFAGLPVLPAETVVRAARYLDLVASWNARIDLTAAKSPEELVDLSFGDAAALVGSGALALNERWLDVGSGAGAPGLPLALLEPRLAMTLLEPMQKRVAFLRTVVGALGLPIEVVRGRVEDYPEHSVGVAVSRATLPPDAWLAAGAKIATREVCVLLAREEPPALPGWVTGLDLSFRWPLTNRARRAVLFRAASP